jgi:hypothetical protein
MKFEGRKVGVTSAASGGAVAPGWIDTPEGPEMFQDQIKGLHPARHTYRPGEIHIIDGSRIARLGLP